MFHSTILLTIAAVAASILTHRRFPVRSARWQCRLWWVVLLQGLILFGVSWEIPILPNTTPQPIEIAHVESQPLVFIENEVADHSQDDGEREAEAIELFNSSLQTPYSTLQTPPSVWPSEENDETKNAEILSVAFRPIASEPTAVVSEIYITGDTPRDHARLSLSAQQILIAFWTLGITVILLRWTYVYLLFLGMIRRLRPAPVNWSSVWDDLLEEHGVRRKIPMLISETIGPALVRRVFDYVLIVPGEVWEKLTPHGRRTVLKHELAHLVRRDIPKSTLAAMLTLLHWFNPFAWLALWRITEASELLCDDFAHNPEICRDTAEYQNDGRRRKIHDFQERNGHRQSGLSAPFHPRFRDA